ncbi:MAG: peptide-methionine (S)-S-oxide reductase MsrA, partial [Thermodesulfobacteriota bacterium]
MSQIITNLNTSTALPPIDVSAPKKIETLTCAMGCFWGPDCRFGAMDGVIRTRVGYAGGTTPDPTYHNIGDHIETIQVDYDPKKISYEEMVNIFWDNHKPTRMVWKRQYASALFFHDEHQEKVARETRDRIESNLGEKVNTELIPFTKFYMAEMYHQKYHLQGYEELMNEYRAMYPSLGDIVNSTSAARVNGYIG